MTQTESGPVSRKDRFIAKVISFITRAVYRDVLVHWNVAPPSSGPQLTVANHFGGVADGIVLLSVLPRRPGIIARDVIWRIRPVGALFSWIGGIPVHKPDDGTADTSANDQMFASCYSALGEGGHLLIFPEGVTRNEPSLATVKTGAARIALGARSAGATGLRILPVGIHYENKAALRSRIVVNGGVPIDVDELATSAGAGEEPVNADNRAMVRTLTDDIDRELRRAAPDFADWSEAHELTEAAEIALRAQLGESAAAVPIDLRERLANVLADRPVEERARIRSALGDYQRVLDGLGVTDAALHERLRSRTLVWSIALQVVVGLLLLPYAVVGMIINVIPFLLVKAVGLWRAAPSMLATVKPVVAILAFGLTWGLVIWRVLVTYGIVGAAAAFVLLPLYGAAALLFAERAVLLGRMIRGWRRSERAGRLADRPAAERQAVVDAVFGVDTGGDHV